MTRKSHFILKAIFRQALTFTPYGVKSCKKQKDVKMFKNLSMYNTKIN